MPMTTNAQSPPPHGRRLRAAGRGVLGLLIALVIAVGVCEFIEWPFLRGPVESRLARLLNRPVRFGDQFGVRFLGALRIRTDHLALGPPPDAGPAPLDAAGQPRDLMRADGVKLALGYASLYEQWKGTDQPLHVRLLDVDALELNLRRSADGRANWQFGAAAPATSASTPRLPQFERLNVRNGELRLEDQPLQLRADLHVSTHEGTAQQAAAAASGRFAASGAGLRIGATLPATRGAAVAPAAAANADAGAPLADDTPGLRVDGTGSYRGAPLSIALRASGLLPLAAADTAAAAVPIWLDLRAGKTRIRLDGTATDLLHFGAMDAAFDASGPSLAAVGDALGVTLPTTAGFKTNGRLKKRGVAWDADIAALAIGTSRLRGQFTFDTGPAVPRLVGTLGGARLALVDLGPAFGAPVPDAPAAASAPARPGRVLPERAFDIPSLRAMDADIAVDLALLDLGTDKLEPFTPLQGRITLQDGVLSVHELLARTAMGAVQGAIALDSRPALPRLDADLRWSGIQLARFVKAKNTRARKSADGTRPDSGYISGQLGGDARLTGAGRSSAALLGSLTGTARLWVQDGMVSHLLVEAAGIDIADALGLYIRGDDQVAMQCAVAKLTLVKGRVLPEVLVIDTHESTLVVGGELSLADESLDLRVSAHPHNFSPLAPRHFSPLAPRTPVDIDGSFADPQVHLAAKPLLMRGGAALALGLINPLAALLALVDLRQPEREVCTAAVARLAAADRPGAVAPTASSSATGKPARAAASAAARGILAPS